jgi:eukaryotic-like serine/threonine-protein kinase
VTAASSSGLRLRMLSRMRWNPFKRSLPEPTPVSDSVFEATVVEDLVKGLASTLPPRAATRPAEPVSADTASIGHVGRYALKSVLGEGGLGTVYAAWDPLLSRPVAVKTLHLHLHAQAEAEALGSLDEMILNEARAAARLSHPHIVTVFDAGPSEQGVYIAMEPLRGRDLRHLLHEGWKPTPVEVAHLVRRVADALAYAHGKGVIHCDIKPANIFMVGRKQPKVLDFGIARIAHRDGPTVEGPPAGSPYYLSPEQLHGGPIDRRCDVYSLGVVMFELLTGHRPFTGVSIDDIALAVAQAPTPLAHKLNHQVPPGLSAIAARAMARAPEDRHLSARHLASALRHWLDSSEAQSTGAPRHRRRIALIGSGLLAVLTASGTALWQARQLPRPGPAGDGLPAEAALTMAPPQVAASNSLAPGEALLPSASSPASPDASAPPSTAAVKAGAKPATASTTRPTSLAPQAAADAGTVLTRPSRASTGTVQFAISPWGEVEVDGKAVGTAPPLTQLNLPLGRHTVTVRNGDFAPLVRTVDVDGLKPVALKHRFGP